MIGNAFLLGLPLVHFLQGKTNPLPSYNINALPNHEVCQAHRHVDGCGRLVLLPPIWHPCGPYPVVWVGCFAMSVACG